MIPTEEEIDVMTVKELKELGEKLGKTLKGNRPALLSECKALARQQAEQDHQEQQPEQERGGPPPPPPPENRICNICGLAHEAGKCPAEDPKHAGAATGRVLMTHALDVDTVATGRLTKTLGSLLGSQERVRLAPEFVAALEGRTLVAGPRLVEAVAGVSRKWAREELSLVRLACEGLPEGPTQGIAWRILVPAALAYLEAEASSFGVSICAEELENAALDPVGFARAREMQAAGKVVGEPHRGGSRERNRSRSRERRSSKERRRPSRDHREKGRRRGGARPFKGKCHKCGKVGHRERDCK
jgi:hypothetical protein